MRAGSVQISVLDEHEVTRHDELREWRRRIAPLAIEGSALDVVAARCSWKATKPDSSWSPAWRLTAASPK